MARSPEERGASSAGARDRLVLPVLPALLLLVGLFVGLFTPSSVRPIAFLATAVVSAAALLPLKGTVLTGVGACAIFFGLMVRFDALRDGTAYSELATLAAIAAFAVFLNRLLGRRAHQLVQVRSVAETAQLAVLHPIPRHLGHVTLESLYLAAAAEARIGGDLYEAIRTPHGVRPAHRRRTRQGPARGPDRRCAAQRLPRGRPRRA